jgi:hypothetical protein
MGARWVMPKNLAAQKVSFSADPSSRISAAILVREITFGAFRI